MADHVKRLVTGWIDAAADGAPVEPETELLTPLVDGIYRLIREAEARARASCIGALPTNLDQSARNQVVEAIRLLELQGKLGRRAGREH
jgi:hypothetical protein